VVNSAEGPFGLSVASRLNRFLRKHGLEKTSIRSLAITAEIDRCTLWKILTGKTKNPGHETVRKFVEAHGGTMEELYKED
jgi:predicted transcriptional regulator